MTTTEALPETRQAADSRFFIDFEAERSELLHLVDLTYTTDVAELKAVYRDELIDAAGRLESYIEQGLGGLTLRAASADFLKLKSVSQLSEEYADPQGIDSLTIPTQRITATQVLVHEQIEESIFTPTIHLRVQTGNDATVSRFVGPGELVEEPSLGRWYGFPLKDTVAIAYS